MWTWQENPILYRASRQGRSRWQRLAERLLLPSLWFLPLALIVATSDEYHRSQFLAGDPCTVRNVLGYAFAASVFCQLAYACLRALSGTVGAFTRERELRTLESLLASRLPLADLLAGKLLGTLGPVLGDLLVGTAVGAAFAWAGVVPLSRVLEVQALTAVYAVFFAVFGLWCSLRVRTSLQAGQLAWVTVVLLAVLAPLGDLVLSITDLHDGLALSLLSPPTTMALALWPSLDDRAAGWLMEVSGVVFALGTVVFRRAALGRLRLLGSDPPALAPQGPAPARRPWTVRLWDNPVWFRYSLLARRQGQSRLGRLRRYLYPLILLGPTVFMVLLALVVGENQDWEELATIGFFLTALGHLVYFSAVALSAGSAAVAGERERQTLDPLLGTLSSGRDLVAGHLAVAAGLPLLEMLAWSPVLALFGLAEEVGFARVLGLEAFTAACVVFSAALGLWLGTRSKTASGATRAAFGVAALLAVGTFLVDLVLHEAGVIPEFLFLFANPLMALVSVLQFDSHDPDMQWLWAVCSVLYLLSAAAFTRFSARRLGHAARL